MVKVRVQAKRAKRGNLIASRSKVNEYVHRELTRLWRDSVKAFIMEASNHVAIDTGMSLASMIPLARAVRLGSFLERSLHGKGFRSSNYSNKGHTDLNGSYISGVPRSKALGIRLGDQAYELEFGTPKRNNLVFKFKIVVYQHYIHELGLGRSPYSGGLQSLEKGQQAFLDYFNTNYSTYIRPGVIYNIMLT